ncbi:MAG: hypothetical protein ACNA8W_06510, partial [Bradymonadaceae bacterium]
MPALKFILAALIVVFAVACSGSGELACSSGDDCFQGEACIDGFCEESSQGRNTEPPVNNDTGQNGENSEPNNDTGGQNSEPNNDTGEPNNDANHNNVDSGHPCRVGDFDAPCVDSDPYQPSTATEPFRILTGDGERFGCLQHDDPLTFEGADVKFEAEVCPNGRDEFTMRYNRCTEPLTVDIFFRVTTPACLDLTDHADVIKISTEGEGKCPVREDDVRQYYCHKEQTQEDGTRHFRLFIP